MDCGVRNMETKTGVYVCSCGANISETVDVDRLADGAAVMAGVTDSGTHRLMCSEEGKKWLEDRIREKGVDRVVVAACSPRQHEHTFRKACVASGLNGFMMQMANIRELCSWVTEDKESATDKAAHLIKAAVNRVSFHTPLAPPDLECNPDTLVIGAGPAGMEAALMLSRKGRKVVLVEKSPCIGGMATRYEEVYPTMECATCMLEPKMDEVLHNENIELLTLSEVEEVLGFFGNFTVKIKKKARYVDPQGCFGCAECYAACPVKVENEYNEKLDMRSAIYTPYTGALPNVPAVDREHCLRFRGEECDACVKSCGFGAIDFSQEDETLERSVGAVVIATGGGLYDCSKLENFGYKKHPNVLTTLELERILSTTGPTNGKIVLEDGSAPAKIAFIHCVGSRSRETSNYCSGVCCMNNLKLARMLKAGTEGLDVKLFYSDMCVPGGNGQDFLDGAIEKGVALEKLRGTRDIKVEPTNGSLKLSYVNPAGEALTENYDFVVLAPAVVPGADARSLAELFSVDIDARGFIKGMHGHIDPVATCLNGVYVAGTAQGPSDIRTSVFQAKSAAGEILSKLVPGEKLDVEAITATMDATLCCGCKMCIRMCPYKAIKYNEDKNAAEVNEALCRGCGTCVATCPSGAAKGRHFDREQIFAEITGVLK